MMKTEFLFAALIACLMIPQGANAQVMLARSVLSAGAVDASEGDIRILGTLGEPLTGQNSNTALQGEYGFWALISVLNTAVLHPIGAEDPSVSSIERIFPNPCNKQVTVRLNLSRSGPVEIRIISAHGRMMGFIHRGFLPAGRYDLEFETTSFPTGRYTINCRTEEQSESEALVVHR